MEGPEVYQLLDGNYIFFADVYTSGNSMFQFYKNSDLSKINGIKVDKHSTGGVGDTTTILLAPMVASCGVPVAKMSGRGLGHTGGTVDKLESFDGFKVELSEEQFMDNVNKHGIAVVGQSGDLAPADKKLYALRDVTATVDHIALIASSIMSKKIASGAEAIVLDVKCGSGAFMKNLEDAKALGKAMVDIGKHVARNTVAVVSDMSQPLGFAVGNALEIIEAIETLKGNGPEDLTQLTITLGSRMLVLAKVCDTIAEAEDRIKEMFANGKAVEKLKEWIGLQGGNIAAIDDYSLLPGSAHTRPIYLKQTGYVKTIDAEEVGKTALLLGAGRETKESSIDLGVGLIIHKKIGDTVTPNEPVATLYYNDDRRLEEATRTLVEAYTVSTEVVSKNTLIYDLID